MLRLPWILVASLMLCLSSAEADLPDPSCITVTLDDSERLLMVPDEDGIPHASFSVRVVNMSDCETVIAGAIVEVLITGHVSGHVRTCDATGYAVGTSDSDGWVHFNIPGGGCYTSQDGGAVVIRVNGIHVRGYDRIVSPDYAGYDLEGQPNLWSHTVDPVDLAAFVLAYRGGIGPASCHDYDNNGVVDPTDLSIFTAAYQGGTTSCLP